MGPRAADLEQQLGLKTHQGLNPEGKRARVKLPGRGHISGEKPWGRKMFSGADFIFR